MSTLTQNKTEGEKSLQKSKSPVLTSKTDTPLIVSARTGLAGKDDAIVKRVPIEYAGKSLQQVLEYVTNHEITSDEGLLVQSLNKELKSDSKVVVANGKKAELEDAVEKYATLKKHILPDKSEKQYLELEIEISSVQEGGYFRFYR